MGGANDEEDEVRRFAHAPTFTTARGKVRVACVCGWPGLRCESKEDATAAYDAHVGHREQKDHRVRLQTEIEPVMVAVAAEALLNSAIFPPRIVH